jgi:hypothetical protein
MKTFKDHFLKEDTDAANKEGDYLYAAGAAHSVLSGIKDDIQSGIIKVQPGREDYYQKMLDRVINLLEKGDLRKTIDYYYGTGLLKKHYYEESKKTVPDITETPTRKTWIGKRPTVFKDKTKYNRSKFKREKLD